jgi:hypothetical protein
LTPQRACRSARAVSAVRRAPLFRPRLSAPWIRNAASEGQEKTGPESVFGLVQYLTMLGRSVWSTKSRQALRVQNATPCQYCSEDGRLHHLDPFVDSYRARFRLVGKQIAKVTRDHGIKCLGDWTKTGYIAIFPFLPSDTTYYNCAVCNCAVCVFTRSL